MMRAPLRSASRSNIANVQHIAAEAIAFRDDQRVTLPTITMAGA
jgi:hypothetical protein